MEEKNGKQIINGNGDDTLITPDLPIRTENEIIPIQHVDYNHLIREAEKRVQFQKKILPIALKVTNHKDWTNQNGNPWLGESGAEKIRNLFGISVTNLSCHKDTLEGQEGYKYTYTANFIFAGCTIPGVGTCTSKDKFFAFANNQWKPPEEVDEGNIQKAAYANMMVNGITRILGLRNLTWQDLESANIPKDKIASVDYDKKGFAQEEISQDALKKRKLIGTALMALSDNDAQLAAKQLVDLTKSDDGKFKGVSKLENLKSTKQINFIFAKVRELFEKKFDWKEFTDSGQLVQKQEF